jgi:small-conductance mechanosensitive channel
MRRYVISRLLERAKFRPATSNLAGIIAQYSIIFLGFIFTLQIIGIDLTGLNVLAGAIGVGVGFGLQTIANNFVSGLIIVFENPFQVGDRVEVGGVAGKTLEIGARSTKIEGDDGTIHIIPNQKLVTENVRSFSRLSQHVPHEIKIPVGYGNDAKKVLNALQTVVKKNPQILPEPKPDARLKAFDVAKLDFVLNIWTAKDMKGVEQFLSELNVQIYDELNPSGITPNTPLAANVNLHQTN